MENAAEELRRLRRTMRDLVALSTLPAVWGGAGPDGITRSLADVVLSTLDLDLVYVRLAGPGGTDSVEIAKSRQRADATGRIDQVRATFEGLLRADAAGPPIEVGDPFGTKTLRAIATRFGVADDQGVLVAGSCRADFPTEQDRLLLGVGGNQTAIAVQRLRSERQVREHRESLRVTLASIGDAVIAADAERRVTFVNTEAARLTGWSPEEALGRCLDDVFRIVNETTGERVECPVRRVLGSGKVVDLANHTVLVARDGSRWPIDDSAAPIADGSGSVLGVVLVFRDITERRRAEDTERRAAAEAAAAAEADAKFRAMFEQGAQFAGILSTDGTVVEPNRQCLDFCGFTRDEVLGKKFWKCGWWDRSPSLVEMVRQATLAAAAGTTFRTETNYFVADGTERSVDLTLAPVTDDGGRVLFIAATGLDITDRKLAERRQRFFAELASATQPLVDPGETIAVTARLLAEQLDANRCAYAELEDESVFVITGDYTRGVSSIVGRWSVTAFGSECARQMLANEPFVVFDSERDPRIGPQDLAAYRASEIRAVICFPLHKDRRFTAAMAVHQKHARQWTDEEIDLVRTVVGRCWEALERSRASRHLREREERFQAVFDSMDEGFCVLEVLFDEDDRPTDYRFLEMNPAFEKHTGLRNGAGRTARELVPDLDESWFETYGSVALTGEPVRFVNEAKAMDRWFDVYAFRLGGRDSRQVAVLFNDVTASKRAEIDREQLLREVEAERERLAEVFKRAPSFMTVLTGPDHVFTLANDRYYQLVGHRDILGKPAREALPEVDGQGFFELLDEVYRTGKPFMGPDMPVLLQREPGRPPEERFVDLVYQALRGSDGSITGIFAQGIDLTERKRAEDELRAKTERLNLLLENVNDYAVVISDQEDVILEWQGGAERITGFTSAEAVGQKVEIIFTPEDRAAGQPEYETRKAAETGRTEDRRWHVRKDGSQFFADGVTVALRDEAGRLRGFGKVFRDATAQKAADEALRDADRRKDQFLATLAHELRNPLAPISNVLQAWPLVEKDQAKTEQMRGLIERQVGQMIRLIDDLLDVSRISRGKIELRKQHFDLAAVVEAALEGVRPFVESCQHELTVLLPSEPVAVDGDPDRLMQVIGNLVHNAAKYSGRNGHIRVSAKRDGAEAVVSVRDNGAGIPPEMLQSIFEMFTQVDQTLDRAHGGLGIGLTLVKTLVELHGGSIEAKSDGPGKGSEFIVRLPADPGAKSSFSRLQGGTSRRSLPPPPSRRVLVVDDMQPSARTLAMMLVGLGQETRTAFDGRSALEITSEFRPDVVFLDIAMPGMNGYEVAKRMRELAGERPVLVALTGYGQEADRRRAFDAGFDHHLVKPTSVDALHDLLTNVSSRVISKQR